MPAAVGTLSAVMHARDVSSFSNTFTSKCATKDQNGIKQKIYNHCFKFGQLALPSNPLAKVGGDDMETTSAEGGVGLAMAMEQQQPLVEGRKIKVMVAIDESDSSFYALRWALDRLFSSLSATPEASQEGGMFTLVHVQQPFPLYVYPVGPGAPTELYAASTGLELVRKAQEEGSAALLDRALRICKNYRINAETLILKGDPKEMICQAVEQLHIDLLVVGSRGLGRLKRAFLGSVSDYCAHHAKCPVLIVKPPKENQATAGGGGAK